MISYKTYSDLSTAPAALLELVTHSVTFFYFLESI